MGLNVFISYRRSDGAEAARLIARELRSRNLTVFVDSTDLEAGQFDESLLRRIEVARCFVVVLTQQSFGRPDTPTDWHYREIRHAFSTGRRVIPVMMPGFLFPPDSKLPKGLETLPRQQLLAHSHEY